MLDRSVLSNKEKWVGGILGIVLIGGWFYWFQYRPMQIKTECSWIHVQNDAVPAIPPSDFANETDTDCEINSQINRSWDDFNGCIEQAGRPGKPSEDYWTTASDYQYETCLRNSGL